MKIKYLFIKITACALCILGTQEAEAQKLYKEGEIIILDCGPDSGFPQTMVETQMGQKTIDNPSNSGGPATNNTETGNINQTVYIKLEIAGSDEKKAGGGTKFTWADAYTACTSKNTGGQTGWRLPTMREQQLIWIFKTAIKALSAGLNEGDGHYWSATESSNSNSACCTNMGYSYSGYRGKTNNGGDCIVRCVREIPYTPATTKTNKQR